VFIPNVDFSIPDPLSRTRTRIRTTELTKNLTQKVVTCNYALGNMIRVSRIPDTDTQHCWQTLILSSVPDPDPPDPRVFGLPDPDPSIIMQK
jgi:hypothetical protein